MESGAKADEKGLGDGGTRLKVVALEIHNNRCLVCLTEIFSYGSMEVWRCGDWVAPIHVACRPFRVRLG